MLYAKQREQLLRAANGFTDGHAMRVHRSEPDVFNRRQMLEEMVKLKHQAYSTAQGAQSVRRIAAVTHHLQIFNLHPSRLERL
jgi:hypothetical protein